MAASLRKVAPALGLLLLLTSAPARGQGVITAEGRIVRVAGADTLPVARADVTLHRISRSMQGAVDSAQTGPDGLFRFRRTADTTAVYLVSARYAGIEYFGTPLRPPGRSDLVLLVSDTSSTAPVRLGARRVIVRPPDESGTRLVVDLLSLRNDGPDTRIGRDSMTPSWLLVLPAGARQAEVQEGDVSPTAVRFHGDTMAVLAPIGPGEKNVMVSYRLPMGVAAPAWSAPVDSFDMMLEEEGATVSGAGLQATAPMVVMETTLRRWTANPPDPGAEAVVRFGDSTDGRRRMLLWLVGVVALGVSGGAVIAWRRGQAGGTGGGGQEATDPVGALARLDAEYAGRRAEVEPEEWTRYEAERAHLKSAALARGRTRR